MIKVLFGSIKKVLFTIMIGGLLFGLAFLGNTDVLSPSTTNAAAKVGKSQISLQSFYSDFQLQLNEQNRQTPENRMTNEQAYNRGFHQQVLGVMATRELLELDAKALGIGATNSDVIELVEGYDGLVNDITGKYDTSKVAEFLARSNSNMSIEEFEEERRAELRRNQLTAALFAGLVTPKEVSEQAFKYITESRSAELLVMTEDAVTKPADPSDEELQAYIDDNIATYTAPDYRRFTLLRIEKVDILPDVSVEEAEVKKLFDYKVQAGRLGTDETRSMVSFTFQDKETADKVTAALLADEAPEDIAARLQIDAPNVYTNIRADGTTDPRAGEEGYKMELGDAKTIEGSFGNFLSVKVTGIVPAVVPDLEAQRAALETEIRLNMEEQKLYYLERTIQDQIDEGGILEDIAARLNLPVASYDFVSRAGKTREDNVMSGLAEYRGVAEDDKILTEIFTSEVGFDGDVFATTAKGLAAVRVDELRPSQKKPFAEVKEQALANWHLEKSDEALGALLDSVVTRVNDGETLKAIAADLGDGAVVREDVYSRLSPTPGVSPLLTQRILETKVGGVFRGTGANNLDRIVGKVLSIDSNDQIMTGSIAEILDKQASESIRSDIEQIYRASLAQTHPFEVLDQNVKAVLGITAAE